MAPELSINRIQFVSKIGIKGKNRPGVEVAVRNQEFFGKRTKPIGNTDVATHEKLSCALFHRRLR
ncbi:MAG: hypothetical protein ACC631_05790 [Halocynthiibacter sp.]